MLPGVKDAPAHQKPYPATWGSLSLSAGDGAGPSPPPRVRDSLAAPRVAECELRERRHGGLTCLRHPQQLSGESVQDSIGDLLRTQVCCVYLRGVEIS